MANKSACCHNCPARRWLRPLPDRWLQQVPAPAQRVGGTHGETSPRGAGGGPRMAVTPGASGAVAGALSRGHVPLANAIVRGHGIWWGDSGTVRARCSTVLLPPPRTSPGDLGGQRVGGCGWGRGAAPHPKWVLGVPEVSVCPSQVSSIPHLTPPLLMCCHPHVPHLIPPPSHLPTTPHPPYFSIPQHWGLWVLPITPHSPSPSCSSWASVSLSEQHSP